MSEIKPTSEELWMMKTQDMGYVLQKAQNEKKIGRLSSTLHYLGDRPASKHVYFADDRRTAASCEVLEARKKRMTILERIDMALQAELQKKGKKRKLRDDELVCPTDQPAYKWRKDRKR